GGAVLADRHHVPRPGRGRGHRRRPRRAPRRSRARGRAGRRAAGRGRGGAGGAARRAGCRHGHRAGRRRAALRRPCRARGARAARRRGPRGRARLDAAGGPHRDPDARGSVRARRPVMRAFTALLRKELRTYFGSPLVYLVAAAFLAYTGYYFHSDLIYFVQFGFGFSIMENFWQLVFVDVRLVLMLAIPLLTMRLLPEEGLLGTLELLLTYPVSARVVVAAKLGACLVVIGLLLGCTLLYPVLVWRVQEFPLAPLVAGYVGLVLLGAMAASYGLFVSSLTESQVLAGFLPRP